MSHFSPPPVLVVSLALALALPFGTRAQLPSPTPDGGYPGNNTAEGDGALHSVTIGANGSGADNTAIGFDALYANTSGGSNTATGSSALINNTTGQGNTATGDYALSNNSVGGFNTANGHYALLNGGGSYNTAIGAGALYFLADGSDNTAVGASAMSDGYRGQNNTATGSRALEYNIGDNNSAYGALSLGGQVGGQMPGANNTALGYAALGNNATGANNIGIGSQAGIHLTSGSNNIEIGNQGVAGDAKKIRIGSVGTQTATFIAGIHGVTVASGLDVVVGSNGQLGTITSSARFKEAIKPMDKASEAILALKPVTFRYKHELDPDGIPQFGLVAEQVEKVNPDLVARDADGKVNTVRYEAVNAMLLNEFLKAHKAAQQLKATVAEQQKQIEALTATCRK